MAEWIPTAEKILEQEFNIKVKHITAKKSFVEQFYTKRTKGKYEGVPYGFPYTLGAWCNSRLKLTPIAQYISSIDDKVYQYVGIAYDEPTRYERLKQNETKKITYGSVLYDNKITEKMAFDICSEYNLVSPIYSTESFRGGCWFCVKQCIADLYLLWKNYPDYYQMLLSLEKDSCVSFKPNQTLTDYTKKFESGYIPQRRKKNNLED